MYYEASRRVTIGSASACRAPIINYWDWPENTSTLSCWNTKNLAQNAHFNKCLVIFNTVLFEPSLRSVKFLLRPLHLYLEFTICSVTYLEGVQKVFALAKKLAINKKSTVVVQSWWNLVKICTSWALYVAWISAWLNQNCGFFY